MAVRRILLGQPDSNPRKFGALFASNIGAKMTKKGKRSGSIVDKNRKLALESIKKLAAALGRHAAREDYERERNDWRKKPRKRVLKLSQK